MDKNKTPDCATKETSHTDIYLRPAKKNKKTKNETTTSHHVISTFCFIILHSLNCSRSEASLCVLVALLLHVHTPVTDSV